MKRTSEQVLQQATSIMSLIHEAQQKVEDFVVEELREHRNPSTSTDPSSVSLKWLIHHLWMAEHQASDMIHSIRSERNLPLPPIAQVDSQKAE